MTHEFKDIVQQGYLAKQKGLKSVLASVVALDGSSYRKPGVRMLILENGNMVGAVSGGCVEKEILLQAQTVFKTGQSKIMTYDGRYRLGCEGVLYILLELFQPSDTFQNAFSECLNQRDSFEIHSYYKKREISVSGIGTYVKLKDRLYSIQDIDSEYKDLASLSVFKQYLPPCFKLIIIGAEHDAVQLCRYASITGWEVSVVVGLKEHKSINDFPGATALLTVSPETFDVRVVDDQTSVVLMTHSFATDLRYLVALKDTNPNYIGILGPTKRRDDLLSQFLEYCPDMNDAFLDNIYGPAGIDIGSVTPQEIAISIMAEILAYTREREPMSLSKKSGKIHSK